MSLKGHRKLIALSLLLATLLAIHLTGGVGTAAASAIGAVAAAFMGGNGAEHFAAAKVPPVITLAPHPAPSLVAADAAPKPDNHEALLQSIVSQLKDLGEGVVALLKKT